MVYKKSYYAIIPANVRYDDDLTPNAKLLYGEVTALCNEKGYCWASNSYFAELYGVSNVSISKWINQLVKNGYLTSRINYKEGSKEILNRYLRIVNDPIKEKFNTPQTKVNEPIKEKFKDNNTLNNTFNNTSNSDNRNSAKAKYDDDSPYLKLAHRLFNHIRQRNPEHKQPNFQTWADDIRKTVELDKRNIDNLTNVLDWSQHNDFWQSNILSAKKLREKYDTLTMQMLKDKPKVISRNFAQEAPTNDGEYQYTQEEIEAYEKATGTKWEG